MEDGGSRFHRDLSQRITDGHPQAPIADEVRCLLICFGYW
jgi:hypothetical protein